MTSLASCIVEKTALSVIWPSGLSYAPERYVRSPLCKRIASKHDGMAYEWGRDCNSRPAAFHQSLVLHRRLVQNIHDLVGVEIAFSEVSSRSLAGIFDEPMEDEQARMVRQVHQDEGAS